MNVAFRVDSSVGIGTGHVYRCLGLAKLFKRHGCDVSFISATLSGSLHEVIRENFDLVTITSYSESIGEQDPCGNLWPQVSLGEIKELERFLLENPIDLLVVDHYGLAAGWFSTVVSLVDRILLIDDRPAPRITEACAYYLNSGADNLTNLHASNHFLGLKYALISESFSVDLSEQKRVIQRNTKCVVFFGGSDQANLSQRFLEELLSTPSFGQELHFKLVVGTANPNFENLTRLASECYGRHQVEVLRGGANFFNLCRVADFAIGAGGVAALERAKIGLPSINVIVAENQRQQVLALESAGACYVIELSRFHEIIGVIDKFIERPDWIYAMSKSGKEIGIGSSIESLVSSIVEGVK